MKTSPCPCPWRRQPGGRACALAAVAIILAAALRPVQAAPEEIQVYDDEMTEPGGFGMDLHNNFVARGSTTPAYPGQEPTDHMFRMTPEFYYGLSDTLELGLYELTSIGPGSGGPSYDGSKLRLKYIAPHDPAQGSFWGMNLEVGDTRLRVAPNPWNSELKFIYGYRTGRWLMVVNGNLDTAYTAPLTTTTEVDSKISYLTDAGYRIGLESYNELGRVMHFGPLSEQSQTLYGVIDTEVAGVDVNLGIGRGLTSASDQWIIKLILGFHF
jgi:hypothetical protein